MWKFNSFKIKQQLDNFRLFIIVHSFKIVLVCTTSTIFLIILIIGYSMYKFVRIFI